VGSVSTVDTSAGAGDVRSWRRRAEQLHETRNVAAGQLADQLASQAGLVHKEHLEDVSDALDRRERRRFDGAGRRPSVRRGRRVCCAVMPAPHRRPTTFSVSDFSLCATRAWQPRTRQSATRQRAAPRSELLSVVDSRRKILRQVKRIT
jgi:hypothetical protein